MKKFSVLSFFFICALQVNAQITLTSATSVPNIGDSVDYYFEENYSFDVSQTGANQTWDFSTATGTPGTLNIIDVSSAMDPSSFPSANLVGAQTVDTFYAESYYSSSSSDLSLEGNYSPGSFRSIYSDKQEFLKFPITYNDSFNETFAGTFELISLYTLDRTGTAVITADGYGNLILPYTTVYNVLKVKITYDITDTLMGLPISTSTQVSNYWFNTATHFYLASTTEDSGGGSSASYIAQSDLVLGVDNFQLKESQITLYPNPANNYFHIKNTSGEILKANIIDISGRNVKTVVTSLGDMKIDVSDLHYGIYLIKFVGGSKTLTKKLVLK